AEYLAAAIKNSNRPLIFNINNNKLKSEGAYHFILALPFLSPGFQLNLSNNFINHFDCTILQNSKLNPLCLNLSSNQLSPESINNIAQCIIPIMPEHSSLNLSINSINHDGM